MQEILHIVFFKYPIEREGGVRKRWERVRKKKRREGAAVLQYSYNAGDKVHVSWEAGEWSHTGHFPITWLQENHYSSGKKRKPQPLVAVSNHLSIGILFKGNSVWLDVRALQ